MVRSLFSYTLTMSWLSLAKNSNGVFLIYYYCECYFRGIRSISFRFHMDKVPTGTSSSNWFDPAVNIRAGVRVLEEAIRRRGDLTAGLQSYSGSSSAEGSYADKVLAEKARLEKAARRTSEPNV